jgi:predicted aminopeptidase
MTLFLSGCQSIYYYAQAVDGQLSILMNRQPISELLTDPDTPEKLKTRLHYLLEVRKFAGNQLSLPIQNNYLSYVNLNRPYVAWNVFAAPEFSLIPRTWCYPVVGCAAYRGYFSEQAARDYANKLKGGNYDVYVGGVTAYSTLGWFDDPVFSTILNLGETESAALVFHELAHQILYVSDDTAFNESFATTVEKEGIRRWLIARNDPQIDDDYKLKYRRQRRFIDLIMDCRRQLDSLYQSELATLEKRNKKEQIIDQLRMQYDTLKKEWPALSGYDTWFSGPLNNAQLISVVTYQDFVPAFEKLLQKKNGNLKQFYQVCQNLAKKKKAERHRGLKGCLLDFNTSALSEFNF